MTVVPNSETRQMVIVGTTMDGRTKEVLVDAAGMLIFGEDFFIIDEFNNVISGSSIPANDVADEFLIWFGT